MWMMLELFTVNLLSIRILFDFEERRSEPMAGGEGQGLRLVVHHGVLLGICVLERRDRFPEIAARAVDFSFENATQSSENIARGIEPKHPGRCSSSIEQTVQTRSRGVLVAFAETGVTLTE